VETQKLMVISDQSMKSVHSGYSTGMNFYVTETDMGFLVVMESGEAMPLYTSHQFHCIDDHMNGIAPPSQRSKPQDISMKRVLENRNLALSALHSASVSQLYTGGTSAFPLITMGKLATNTIFKRYTSSAMDHRFVDGELTPGTYVTSTLDSSNANTGFGAVGRYALPIPLPASNVIEYEIEHNAEIEIGTVAPNFGQSGGGVEIRFPRGATVLSANNTLISDY